jgi:asparagine synthetase B (glutamine-hydrolysing)
VCGIWFSLGFAPDPARIDVVTHRGPDGSGWKVFESAAGPVALGHRRLSIIDLSDAALDRLVGMFAFVLCTGRHRLLLLRAIISG